MKSFSDFCEEILKQVKETLPPPYGEGECLLREIQKINETYTGLIIRKKDQPITIAVKLEQYYQDYRNGTAMETILDSILKQTEDDCLNPLSFIPNAMKSYESVRPRLFLRVSNKAMNQELLNKTPHKTVMDLALTYHISLKELKGQNASIMVNGELLESWKITKNKLHLDCLNNSPRIMPCEVLPIQKVLKDSDGPKDLIQSQRMPLYVVRSKGWGSAAALFYPGTMQKLSEIAKGNYYILPSSIHEVLMLPAGELADLTSLKTMVREINKTIVEENSRLSDNVYLYDRQKDALRIAE